MIKAFYHTKNYVLLPQEAAELSSAQWVAVAGILHNAYPMQKAAAKLLRVLCGLNWLHWLRLPAEHKVRLLPYVQWVIDDGVQCTQQKLPVYRGMYGPAAGLDNITLSEFYFSEQYYAAMLQDDAAINMLVATLYRPVKPNYDVRKNLQGDCRVPFTSAAADYYSKVVARWPLAVRQAIVLWYDACREQIIADNPEVFSSRDADGDGDGGDMFAIMRSLADGGKYGNFEQVEQLLLPTALLEMNMLIAENRRLETELKKQK